MNKNKLALGTVQFGLNYGINNTFGKTPKDEVAKILEVALNHGINTLDTANAYGDSETVLGKNDLSEFNIITKFREAESYNSFKNQIIKSFENLNQHSIYGVMAHSPITLLKKDYYLTFLNKLKSEGRIRKIGASFNTIEEIEQILKSKIDLDIVQFPFNILDNRFEPYMKILKLRNVEIHVRSTFLQGLFFCKTNELNKFFNPIKDYIRYLQSFHDKLPILLLEHSLKQSFIDKVVVGVNNKDQFEKNILGINNSVEKIEKFNLAINEDIITPSRWPKN